MGHSDFRSLAAPTRDSLNGLSTARRCADALGIMTRHPTPRRQKFPREYSRALDLDGLVTGDVLPAEWRRRSRWKRAAPRVAGVLARRGVGVTACEHAGYTHVRGTRRGSPC